jgi:ribonuclease P protein component
MPSGLRSQRLRLPSEIRAVFAARSSAHGRAVVVRAGARPDEDPARWTVVAGRKVGNAVQRNRAKRRIRAVLQGLTLPAGMDLVVVARSSAQTVPFSELQREVGELVAKAASKTLARTKVGR